MTALADLTARMLDAARKAGADQADAIAIDSTMISIDVRQGQLEQAERAEGVEIGLRVFMGQRSAIVSSSDARDSTLHEMAERAVAMARIAPEDPHIGLADPAQLAQNRDMSGLDLCDPAAEPDPAQLVEMARAAEAAALGVTGITQVQSASVGYSAGRIHLAATNGFDAGYGRTDTGMSVTAIGGTGTAMERDYDYDSRVYFSDLTHPETLGRRAAERTVARLGAIKPPTGRYPVLFDERVANTLIGHLSGAINGAAIARGASFLRDKLGQQVLPKGLSLVEDPHRPRLGGSRLFDAEGLQTARRALVEDGILQGWTLDLATARKLGLESTASASRGASSNPSPAVTHLELTQGSATREDLIRDMGTGLLVTGLIGSTINSNTGDYSRGANGFWVENGVISHPVHECTIAGNLIEMLLNLTPANDARRHVSRVIPSLLVDSMMLAGA